mgnify:CR=1 FL=1
MQSALKRTLAASAIAASILGWSLPTAARPYPDRLGICYFYEGEIQETLEPCVIGSGYGAGAHYTTLHWSDGVVTRIDLINACEPDEFDARGFCAYTVDDSVAAPYERDVFLEITTVEDPDNLSCYRVIETDNSVCFRFEG